MNSKSSEVREVKEWVETQKWNSFHKRSRCWKRRWYPRRKRLRTITMIKTWCCSCSSPELKRRLSIYFLVASLPPVVLFPDNNNDDNRWWWRWGLLVRCEMKFGKKRTESNGYFALFAWFPSSWLETWISFCCSLLLSSLFNWISFGLSHVLRWVSNKERNITRFWFLLLLLVPLAADETGLQSIWSMKKRL